jgi:solute carrier family 35 (GDP-fucose transporter), member C1
VILETKTSFQAIQASIVVFVGFIVGSVGEINFTMIGVVYGVLSSVFVALNGMYLLLT